MKDLESGVLTEMRLTYLAAQSDHTLDLLSDPDDGEPTVEAAMIGKAKLIRSLRRLSVKRLEQMGDLLVLFTIEQTPTIDTVSDLRPIDLDAVVEWLFLAIR